MIPLPPPQRILVLTDGRPGNENPALGLAEALARRSGARIETRRIAMKPWASRLPAALWGLPIPGLARLSLGRADGVFDAQADLVIGAGRRSAPIVASLRAPGREAVQFMAPQMPASRFSAVIAPEHDGLSGPNVLGALGSPTRITPEAVATAAAALPPEWRPETPALAVMIGGPSGAARFGAEEEQALLGALHAAKARGLAPLLIPSRRTPGPLTDRLAAEFPAAPMHLGDGPNPYPGTLGAARAALVTADSVNMCSEAASAGLPLHVLPIPGLAPKLRRFHAALAARIPVHGPESVGEAPPPPAPLAEADRIAALLLGA